jgi:3-phosphoshikimate 1-carboxyvinyltransferase
MTVEGCGRDSLQGDVRFAEVMEQMGAQVQWQPHSITITGTECFPHSIPITDPGCLFVVLSAVTGIGLDWMEG